MTGARCRQRFEAESGENTRRACIPGIWDDEGARAPVEGAERLEFLIARHAKKLAHPGKRQFGVGRTMNVL